MSVLERPVWYEEVPDDEWGVPAEDSLHARTYKANSFMERYEHSKIVAAKISNTLLGVYTDWDITGNVSVQTREFLSESAAALVMLEGCANNEGEQ